MSYLNGDSVTIRGNIIYTEGIIDQVYDPSSPNAQSGKAVASALEQYKNEIVQQVIEALRSNEST